MVTGTVYNVFLYHNKAKFVWRHLKILKMHYCIYISLLFMIFFSKSLILLAQVASNIGFSWQTLERIVYEQIRSVESTLTTKTCQSVFGPFSNNTVKPSAISGERVRILLPVENTFQTPFLLKKIHLLWKFTSPDEMVFSNDTNGDTGGFIVINSIGTGQLTIESSLRLRLQPAR